MSDQQTQKETLASALLAMTYADKEVHPVEIKALEKCLERLGCTVQDIRDTHIIEDDFASIKDRVPADQCRDFLSDLLRVAYSDLELSPEEFELAIKVARLLDISDDEVEELRERALKEVVPSP